MTEVGGDIFNPIHNEQTADVMYLRFYLGYDYATVAEELGISEESAMHIALKGLKRTKELVFGE